jgi:hypothetical protein
VGVLTNCKPRKDVLKGDLEDAIFAEIVRWLFEKVDPTAAQSASATYFSLYQRVARDTPDLLPQEAVTSAYAARIVQSYPFHPRLLDTASNRLGALQDFQKSRGVLRLFARQETPRRACPADPGGGCAMKGLTCNAKVLGSLQAFQPTQLAQALGWVIFLEAT